MKRYLHLLERLGLSEHERAVYMTLLEHPYLIVSDIAEKTNTHRPMVYKSLRSLEADWLVEKSYLDGKRYFYHVTSPKKLRDKLNTLNSLAENTLPELELMYEKKMHTPILSIKEWVDGIRSIHADLLQSVPKWGIYYRYSSSRTEYEGKSIYTPDDYESIQKKKEFERIVITNVHQAKKRMNDPNREVIMIPSSFDEFWDNISKIIFANKVAIIDYDSQIGWVIENERFARYEEKLFRLLAKLIREKENPDREDQGNI